MSWIQQLATELSITASSREVWTAIAQSLLFASASLGLGMLIAKRVGLLQADASPSERVTVGLATGLMAMTAWVAVVGSGGRTAFTPVAIGFGLALVLSIRRMRRIDPLPAQTSAGALPDPSLQVVDRTKRTTRLSLVLLGAGAFIVASALIYGSTMTLRAREGVQPIEFMDEAFYSILGADLAASGTESIYPPSGFSDIEGLPTQSWYHWGEIWLAAGAINMLGAGPLEARHLVILPVLLLAVAMLTGTIVSRMSGAASRAAFLAGFVACVSLAPIQLLPGPHFSSWAVGMIFGITQYGMGAVAALTAIYLLWALRQGTPTWPSVVFAASTAAFLLPAHLVIAALAVIGAAGVAGVDAVRALVATRRLPALPAMWIPLIVATGTGLTLSLIWGLLTGHNLGGSGLSASVTPFNDSWQASLLITTVGAGAILAVPIAWGLMRNQAPLQTNLYLGTTIMLVFGGLAWGARLGDFNMFHAFFGGIAVFATPVAAIAVWTIWLRLRATPRRPLALGLVVLFLLQVELGLGIGITRLIRFGPGNYEPVPSQILAAIRSLPADAKLAYSCQPNEELAYWDSRLLGISAHTGRRIVSMCFQSEALVQMVGTRLSPDIESPLFRTAPQRALYPTSASKPTRETVVSFLKANGIDYIYADGAHPNELDPSASIVSKVEDFQLLKLP